MPKLSLGEIFSVSRQSVHPLILSPFLVPTIFYILSTSYLFQYLGTNMILFQTGDAILSFVYRWLIFILSTLLLYSILMIFSFNLSSILLRDFATIGKKNYVNSIREAYSKIIGVFLVNIMAFIIFITGILFYAVHPLLILMGFFLAPFLVFVTPSIIIDNLSPFKAIKNSLILSLHYTFPSFVLFIFSFILIVAIPIITSLGLYFLFSAEILGNFIIYGLPILEMVFASYISILLTVSYLNYRGY